MGRWGFMRWGVRTRKWEDHLEPISRDYTRIICNRSVVADSTSGIYVPTFTIEEDVRGVLVEKGSTIVGLPAGVYVRMDAAFVTLDIMLIGDRLRDDVNSKLYEVIGEPAESRNELDGFMFRVCQLHLKQF